MPSERASPDKAPPASARWICPVCHGVTASRPGNCPRCGGALEHGALSAAPDAPTPELRKMARRLWLALLLGVPLIGLGTYDTLAPDKPVAAALGEKSFLLLQTALCMPLVFVCGGPFLLRAWRSVHTRRPTLDTLLGIGIAASFLYSLVAVGYTWLDLHPLVRRPGTPNLRPELEGGVRVVAPDQRGTVDPFFESCGMIVLLALVGRVLELRARRRAGAALQKLAPLAPRSARVALPDGTEQDRPVDAVRVGDRVRVRPNERIPVDGVIREGSSTIDESMLTGEPVRAGRGPGGRVLAGSENGLQPITVEATRAGSETLLGQVLGLVEQAQQHRFALERTTDRLMRWYVPVVLVVALGALIGWAALGPRGAGLTYGAVCAVGVLVVACPCAVGLATSAATVAGMRRAAKAGVVFRDPAVLEALAAVDTVLFDKTGTLTEGRPRLAEIIPNVGYSTNVVLTLAAAVERGSEHPLGLAIVWEAARRGLEIATAEGVESVIGRGVRGTVGGRRVAVGRIGFIQESGVHADLMLGEAQTHRHLGHVVVFVGEGTRCAGLIVMHDPVRAGARAALNRLRAAGLRLLMMTGDHTDTAHGVARALALADVVGDASPIEKFAAVQKLRGEGHVVAMCGDGINDAPALVAADVGIALAGAAGAAIGTAGVTLLHADLRGVETAREVSRATVRTIRRNLLLAFPFNVLAIPVAAGVLVPFGGGLINSVWAAAAMSVGSVAVLVNSLLLIPSRVDF